jgi:four helix bundle protein
VAEGFGRYYRGEFVRYLRIAAASLHETKDHLHEARDRGFVTESRHLELIRLTLRALKANTRLQQALRQKQGRDD